MHRLSFAALFLAAAAAGCTEDSLSTGPTVVESVGLQLRFNPTFGTAPLGLNRKYLNAAGDSVQFTALRFFVSEVALIDTTGAEVPLDGLFLVDLSDPQVASTGGYTLQLRAKPGRYAGMRFSVGLPSALNHQDASTQAAPLGPNSQMYWAWNPGYVFHRIEGRVDSGAVQRNFMYHIGEDNRKVTVRLASLGGFGTPTTGPTRFTVAASGDSRFPVKMDYSKLFTVGMDGVRPMQLRLVPAERVHHSGPKTLADRTAANSQLLFSRGE